MESYYSECMNPFLLIAQIGMLLVGLVAVLWWKINKKVKWKYFCFGALLWIIAIVPKVIMDFTVSAYLLVWLSSYGIAAMLVGMGLYVGLRTGFFESGFSYLAIAKTKFRKMKLNEALAFGIGFGSIEAIAIGLIGLISMLVLISNPALVELLPPAQQAALDLPTILVFAPIIERTAAVMIHVFSSMLVVYAVVKRKINYLFISILFKTLVDGIIPLLTYAFDLTTVTGIYMIEIPFVVLGVLAFYGTKLVAKKF